MEKESRYNEIVPLNKDHFFKTPFYGITKKGTKFAIHAIVNTQELGIAFYGMLNLPEGNRVAYVSISDITEIE